ncbi:ABC transporter permease [Chloroflexota bacterium]
MTTEVFDQKNVADRETPISILLGFIKEKPLGASGGLVLILMILVAILAPLIAPQDPLGVDLAGRLAAPSLEHLMGTDQIGRDLLSRVIYGARISMLVGITCTLIGSSVGAILGVISGYIGGWVDMVFQRIMDILLAFPSIILAMAIIAVLGNTIPNVILAITIPLIPRTNRVVRSVALSVKEFQYIEAAKGVGAGEARIMFRHVLPNCMASYLIVATAMLGGTILVEASLSFLGLGIPPPNPSWGRALSEAMAAYIRSPWLAIFPGIAISLTVFGANIFGDALRDVWDPRLKGL